MNKYDIIIFGGGTAGCSAAYTAGKLGFKTLVVEKNIHLGGSITSGLVVPAMKAGNNLINTDFFSKLIYKLNQYNGQITYMNNPGWFNPELAKIALDEILTDAGVEIQFNSCVNTIKKQNKQINGVNISSNILSVYNESCDNTEEKVLSEYIEADYFIDATGNCDFAYKCGCEFLSDKGTQPMSLRFIMDGIDLRRFADWLIEFDTDRDVTTVEEINGQLHLSTAYTWDTDKKWALAPLFDKAVKCGILKDEDRNYFQIFTIPGMPTSIAFNCPRIIYNSNKSEVNSVSNYVIKARQAIYRIANFCKIYLPGFENAFISNIADEIGIRVSRRLKGKYIYTIDDIKSQKKFKNPVLRSDYPIDIHSANKNSSTLKSYNEYELPVESLMSADFDNLFVVGRSISADFMSQGTLRIQPNCFAMAEGLIKYLKNNS